MTKQKCKLCNKPLVAIGSSRKNGVFHKDWDSRQYHKGCLRHVPPTFTTDPTPAARILVDENGQWRQLMKPWYAYRIGALSDEEVDMILKWNRGGLDYVNELDKTEISYLKQISDRVKRIYCNISSDDKDKFEIFAEEHFIKSIFY